jgi:hypothetical protein
VSAWAEVSLGVIAVATLATAVVQVGLLIAAGRLAKRVERLVGQAERELIPLYGHLNSIGHDAARATSLATAQVERVDRLVGDAVLRLEQTLDSVQHAVAAPAREGAAVLAGLRAILNSIRTSRQGRGRYAEDDDALFI